MMFLGKALKYTFWGASVLTFYHIYLVRNNERPENASLVSQPFLDLARKINWTVYDIGVLLTKPGMTKMLPDRLDIPGMP